MNQRLSFLLGPGGLTASAFFAFKLLSGLEVFRFASKALPAAAAPELPEGWAYQRLSSLADLARLPAGTATQIAAQSGPEPERLLQRGCSIHVLLCGEAVVAQLNIETGPVCAVDDPKLALHLSAGDGFLGFLYTWPEFRRRGAAQLLIAATEQGMREQGLSRLVTHVRATNVPSMAVFKNLGCRFNAVVFSRAASGVLVGSLGMRRLGLQALPASQAQG